MDIEIRKMLKEDYASVHKLWETIHGFALRSIDDSQKGIEKFINRNPNTSIVAEHDGKIIGTILCGHDGRTATFYHVCVDENYRRCGVGKKMVVEAMKALKEEEINTISLIAFTNNDVGNAFWNGIGWTKRSDANQYNFKLNEENIIAFTK